LSGSSSTEKYAIFILAGGFGTRLKGVLDDIPKPMAPVNGKPFLNLQTDYLRKYFHENDIYILTHFLSEKISGYFKDFKNIRIIKEETPLGTGGSIKHALKKLAGGYDGYLILNGDTYFEADLAEFIKTAHCDINMLTCFQEKCERFGQVLIENGYITSFAEKGSSDSSFINAGCYFFKNGDFLLGVEDERFSLEKKLEDHIIDHKIGAYKYRGIFIDIGIPEDYDKIKEIFKDKI